MFLLLFLTSLHGCSCLIVASFRLLSVPLFLSLLLSLNSLSTLPPFLLIFFSFLSFHFLVFSLSLSVGLPASPPYSLTFVFTLFFPVFFSVLLLHGSSWRPLPSSSFSPFPFTSLYLPVPPHTLSSPRYLLFCPSNGPTLEPPLSPLLLLPPCRFILALLSSCPPLTLSSPHYLLCFLSSLLLFMDLLLNFLNPLLLLPLLVLSSPAPSYHCAPWPGVRIFPRHFNSSESWVSS